MFCLHQGFLNTPLAYSLRDHNLWKKSEICSLQRKTLLAPFVCPLTENYRLSDKKLYTIDRHLMGRSRKQHPVVLATSRKRKLRSILLIPAVKDFMLQNFTVWLYTNIKPQSSAPINHTENFWELAHCRRNTKPNQGSSFWGKLWRNGGAWTSWNPTQQLNWNNLLNSGFLMNHAINPGVVHSVEGPSPFWMKKQRKPLGCDSLYFRREVSGLAHAPRVRFDPLSVQAGGICL